MRDKPWIVLVGGFLGAGKTTLLMAAAQELDRRGLRSGLILNDQGAELVDAEFSALQGRTYGAVAGGCFCCRLSDLVRSIEELRRHRPDVIFAEPVGSCTDLVATTVRPLQELVTGCRIAPLTVLVDPSRANDLLGAESDGSLSYLFRKQLEEADLVCVTKSDLYPNAPSVPCRAIRQISAKTGQGVAAWLDEILSGELSVGSKALDINYEQYAQAEAALAWLNMNASLRATVPTSPGLILGPLLEALDANLTGAGIEIVHLKAIVSAETGFIKAAICRNGEPPAVEGMLTASPASRWDLLINLRAVGTASTIRRMIEDRVSSLPLNVNVHSIECFHPRPPEPKVRTEVGSV